MDIVQVLQIVIPSGILGLLYHSINSRIREIKEDTEKIREGIELHREHYIRHLYDYHDEKEVREKGGINPYLLQ